MDDLKLDPEEQEILDAFERGELVPVKDREARLAELRESAKVTLNKERRINIRITLRDLIALKGRAQQEGMPYQTLAASVLHKYVEGRLIELGEYERAVQLASAVAEGRGVYRVKEDSAGQDDTPISSLPSS